MKDLITTGAIQAGSGLPYWKVVYILKTRNIEPKGRVGPVRVYSRDVIEQVKRIGASMKRGSMAKEHREFNARESAGDE